MPIQCFRANVIKRSYTVKKHLDAVQSKVKVGPEGLEANKFYYFALNKSVVVLFYSKEKWKMCCEL